MLVDNTSSPLIAIRLDILSRVFKNQSHIIPTHLTTTLSEHLHGVLHSSSRAPAFLVKKGIRLLLALLLLPWDVLPANLIEDLIHVLTHMSHSYRPIIFRGIASLLPVALEQNPCPIDAAVLLPPVLLALHDSTYRTRQLAEDILNILSSHHTVGPVSFLEMLSAGLVSEGELRSCTIVAITKILHHHRANVEIQELYQSQIFGMLYPLWQDPTREIFRAMLGFFRVCLTYHHMINTAIQMHSDMSMSNDRSCPCPIHETLRDVLTTLCTFHQENGNKPAVLGKIRVWIKKLIKILGYDVVLNAMPTTDHPLVNNLNREAREELEKSRLRQEKRQKELSRLQEVGDEMDDDEVGDGMGRADLSSDDDDDDDDESDRMDVDGSDSEEEDDDKAGKTRGGGKKIAGRNEKANKKQSKKRSNMLKSLVVEGGEDEEIGFDLEDRIRLGGNKKHEDIWGNIDSDSDDDEKVTVRCFVVYLVIYIYKY